MQRSLLTASFLPAILFPSAAILIGLRNPSILDTSVIFKTLPFWGCFFVMLVFLLVRPLRGKSAWASANLAGPGLFFLFSLGYLLLASLFNKSDINTNNIYFAADSFSWYLTMGATENVNTDVRAVHPLAYLIFRPTVALLSALTFGDRFATNLLLLSMAGGGCVFLAWKIIRLISGSEVHAVLFASLLGVSASHLIFGSVIESYIFSAFFLLLFLWLLVSNRPGYLLAAASILTLGVTVTNIVQNALAAILIQRNLRRVILFFFVVVLLGAGLNVISRLIYPMTDYFFLPQNLAGEQRFVQEINLKRAALMAEDLFLFNVAAPQPYVRTRNEMPRFSFLNGTISDYAWFGWPSLLLWTLCLVLAFGSFFRDIRARLNERSLLIALLACLGLNFMLHVGYGTEPFLYSADWTYALILFAGISLQEYAERTWFKTALFGLVMAVLVNNLWLMYLVARNVAPFLG